MFIFITASVSASVSASVAAIAIVNIFGSFVTTEHIPGFLKHYKRVTDETLLAETS